MRGMLAGALSLVALHTLVAYRGSNERFAELVGDNGVLVTFVRRFLDPSIPAIGDHRDRDSGEPGGKELVIFKPTPSSTTPPD